RRLHMPDALEFPGVRRAVVPEVRAGRAAISEFIFHRFPGLAAVAGSLDLLPEPAARLRNVDAVRIGRRTFHVIDFPPAKMRPADFPVLTFAVGSENESAFSCADQYTHLAHLLLLARPSDHFHRPMFNLRCKEH